MINGDLPHREPVAKKKQRHKTEGMKDHRIDLLPQDKVFDDLVNLSLELLFLPVKMVEYPLRQTHPYTPRTGIPCMKKNMMANASLMIAFNKVHKVTSQPTLTGV